MLSAAPALAAESGPGKCGNAPYKKETFAKKLGQVKSRTSSLCKQQKALAQKMNSLSASCKDANFQAPVKDIVDRSNHLCKIGPKSIEETEGLCREYDASVKKSSVGINPATTNTNSQSSAFTQRSSALAGAGTQMVGAAKSARSVSERLKRNLPASSRGASSEDPKIKAAVAKFDGLKKSKGITSASCKQLNENFGSLANLMQQNLMPNLRVLEEGVASIQSNASSSGENLNKMAASDAATASKMSEAATQGERDKQIAARNKPMNQANPRDLASSAGGASAINAAQVSPLKSRAGKDQADAYAAEAARKAANRNAEERMTFKAFDGNLY